MGIIKIRSCPKGKQILLERGELMPNRIQERRLELELTQAELAKKLKISISYLSRLENEKVNINVSLAIRIARALRTSVEELFF